MKTQDILKCLKANKNLSAYQLIENEKDSRELFYVLDHLEINRAVKTTTTIIVVYVNHQNYTGSSTITVTSGDDEKSLNKKIKDAIVKAKAVKNAYYPALPEIKENVVDKNQDKYDLNSIANNVAKAVFKANKYDSGWLNSTEIFVSTIRTKFFDSNNVKHDVRKFNISVEVIPTWTNSKEEIELYKWYETSDINYSEITKEIDELLLNAKDRSEAKKLKDVKLPKDLKVLVKNDMLDLILDTFAEDINLRSVFYKQNHYNKNDLVSDNKLSLTLKPVVKGCSASSKIDNNGMVLKNTKIISDGKVKKLWGDNRFAYYLKQDPTGDIPVKELDGERFDYSKDKHLIIENFSSPQLDEASGYWGGEVRLAKYFDGKKYIPLTSFSISGNIYEDFKNVKLSKEEVKHPSYKGPKYLIFEGVKIH